MAGYHSRDRGGQSGRAQPMGCSDQAGELDRPHLSRFAAVGMVVP